MYTQWRSYQNYYSQLSFVLRDLNYELLARLTDELLLNDKNAKAIASTKCLTRASQNAHIGEGNIFFFQVFNFGTHIFIITSTDRGS